jgi:hypothetical protein
VSSIITTDHSISKPFKYTPGSLEHDYLSATYDYNDLFYPDPESNSTWTVTVTRSLLMGQCYTFQNNKMVHSISVSEYIPLVAGNDLTAYCTRGILI